MLSIGTGSKGFESMGIHPVKGYHVWLKIVLIVLMTKGASPLADFCIRCLRQTLKTDEKYVTDFFHASTQAHK